MLTVSHMRAWCFKSEARSTQGSDRMADHDAKRSPTISWGG